HIDLDRQIALADLERIVAFLDGRGAILLDRSGLVVVHFDPVVVPDPLDLVVLDGNDVVLFGAEIDILIALLVLEAEFVEILVAALQGAAAVHAALRLVVGQLPRRQVLAVIDAACDDRLIGIPFKEIHDHFVADPRDVDHAPGLAGPGGGDADPAGAVLVLL